jgi:hypothetical protein
VPHGRTALPVWGPGLTYQLVERTKAVTHTLEKVLDMGSLLRVLYQRPWGAFLSPKRI